MRLALVVPVFPQVSETFISTKAIGLVDRGIDLHVLCSASPEGGWASFGADHRVHGLRDRVHVAPGLSLHRSVAAHALHAAVDVIRAPSGAIRRYLANDGSTLHRRARDLFADATLLRLAPDVVHFEFGSLAPSRMALRDRLHAAVTVSFRGYDLNYVGLDQPGHYQDVWDHADGVHVLGRDLWKRAVHRGAPEGLAHSIISPAIDIADISAPTSRPGAVGDAARPLRILSVGRLHWKKGYDYALEAVASLRAQDIQVEHRIIGDGDLLGAVSFWRHQLGLDDVVELLRSLPPADVAAHLEWADVLLHAATSEGFCNAVIEAQAHGVPVVCTDADGLPENVESGVTGIVVPRRDPASLADGLARLAVDGERRAAMGAAGRQRVERLFRLADHLDAWERFYLDAVHHRGSTASFGKI